MSVLISGAFAKLYGLSAASFMVGGPTNQSPVWQTTAGSLGIVTGDGSAALRVRAADTDGSIASYTIVDGSLPDGLALDASTGTITGTVTIPVEDEISNFTIRATDDDGDHTDRAFSLTVHPANLLVTQQRINGTDIVSGDRFGLSVAMSGDATTAIVGAYDDSTPSSRAGSAFVFLKSGSDWVQQARLNAADGAYLDWFGTSVDLSEDGNTAVVTAPNTTANDSGGIYVFTRSDGVWSQIAKLVEPDAAVNDYLGDTPRSVSISADGTTIICGSRYNDTAAGGEVGCVYVYGFDGTTWGHQATIIAADAAESDFFGHALALSTDGNTVVISAPRDDESRGAAYVFTRTGQTWNQTAKLVASDRTTGAEFGNSVDVSPDGSTVIVGSIMLNSSRGAAYVFVSAGNGWTQQAKLQASDGSSNDQFSYAVSLSRNGNIAVVTARTDAHSSVSSAGSVYVFTRSGTIWTERHRRQITSPVLNERLGAAAALSFDGTTAIVGAAGGPTAGFAMVFSST